MEERPCLLGRSLAYLMPIAATDGRGRTSGTGSSPTPYIWPLNVAGAVARRELREWRRSRHEVPGTTEGRRAGGQQSPAVDRRTRSAGNSMAMSWSWRRCPGVATLITRSGRPRSEVAQACKRCFRPSRRIPAQARAGLRGSFVRRQMAVHSRGVHSRRCGACPGVPRFTGMNRNNPISLANRDTMCSGQAMSLDVLASRR